MLKLRVKKEAWEKAGEEERKLIEPFYKLIGEEYVLDVESEGDVGELRRAKERIETEFMPHSN